MTADQCEKMAPEAYLNPDLFRSEFDHLPAENYAQQQYETGLRHSTEWPTITIACNGCWGASGKEGATLTSYERIGYHSGTAPLLRGLLAGTAEVIVYRYTSNGITRTTIKPRS